jgi:hypothetical protein
MARRAAPLIALAALAMLVPPPAGAAGLPTADEIAARAHGVGGGDDGVGRVSFVIERPDAAPIRQDFAMLWKRYPDGPVDTKVIFFPEFPPDRKGYNWMGFLARPGGGGEDAAWMYLPDLRAVRRIHGPEAGEDPFHHSLLAAPELIPRLDPTDRHRLLRTDTLDGVPVYVLETTRTAADYPYPRTVRWISRDEFLTLRIEHHTPTRLIRAIRITWGRAGKRRVWERVEAEDPGKGTRTVMTLTDQRVDVGLDDRRFSEATLRGGPERFLRPPP